MADQPDKLVQEARRRLDDCRRQKEHDRRDLEEAFWFISPRSSRDLGTRGGSRDRPDDAGELLIDIGIEASQDFANFMLHTFLPEAEPWASRGAGQDLPQPLWNRIRRQVEEADERVFNAIRASDFRSAASQAFLPNLAAGTVAMWIDDELPYAPIQCRPVPLRELEINVGPDGRIDDRFVVVETQYRYLPRLLGDMELPERQRRMQRDRPNGKVKVTWGFWRRWDERDDMVWQAVVLVGTDLAHETELRGAGSCPLLVARFNPDPMFAWGEGVAITALPTLRLMDAMTETILKRWEVAADPPFAYPDDGIINFDGGIKPGHAYPMQPGSDRGFANLYFDGDVDFSVFSMTDIERRIRRLFYVDEPIQRGDTPPSATQWWEETVRQQRRIGTPGQIFWREFAAEAFQRFDHLLRVRGEVDPIMDNGRVISLVPENPATRAADMQEVETSLRFNESAMAIFPQEHQLMIDAQRTMRAWHDKMGDRLTQFRSPEEVQQAMERLMTLAQGTGVARPGAPGGAGAGEAPGGIRGAA